MVKNSVLQEGRHHLFLSHGFPEGTFISQMQLTGSTGTLDMGGVVYKGKSFSPLPVCSTTAQVAAYDGQTFIQNSHRCIKKS